MRAEIIRKSMQKVVPKRGVQIILINNFQDISIKNLNNYAMLLI